MKPASKRVNFQRALVHRRRESTKLADDIDALLVVELTRLGDVLSVLPAARRLFSLSPSVRAHFFIDERYTSLIRGLTLDAMVHGIPASATPSGLLRAVRMARALHVGLACSMSPAKRNVLVTLTSGAPLKAGYLRPVRSLVHYQMPAHVETRGFSLQGSVSNAPECNIEERGMRVCQSLGVRDDVDLPPLEIRPELLAVIRRRLESQGVLPPGKYVVIHPFSGWTYRSWSTAKYIELAGLLSSRMGLEALFLFAPGERAQWESSAGSGGKDGSPRVFCSADLLESAVLIKGARLFVGNDSGPLHLAACLDTPHIGLFGPSTPGLTAPRSGIGVSLYKRVSCSPCAQITCICPDSPCIELITPEEVFAAAACAVDDHLPERSAAHG